MQVQGAARGDGRFEEGVCGLGARLPMDETQAADDAVDVGVDGEGGQPAGEEEDARSRLGSDAGEAREAPVGGVEVQTPEGAEGVESLALPNLPEHAVNAKALGLGQASHTNGALDLRGPCLRRRFPGRKGLS